MAVLTHVPCATHTHTHNRVNALRAALEGVVLAFAEGASVPRVDTAAAGSSNAH